MMNEATNILIIDDEKIICFSCKQALEKEGMIVDCAENGIIGLAKIQDKAYDLVLIDLMMPQMSGLEVLDALQKYDSSIVAILITGFSTIESAVEAMKRGAYDYIPKPFTPDELRRVVHKGLERRKLLAETSQLREERVLNLEKLAAEQSRLETIINCMGEGLIATDKEGHLLLINSVACRLLNIKEPCQTGIDIRGNLNNAELETWIYDTLQRCEFPKEFINKEIIFDDKAGKIYSITLAPIKEKENLVTGLALVLMDVSSEKKLERRKVEFQKLVSIVSHELKAPINAIEGYLDIIIKGYVKDNPQKELEYLTRCRDKAEVLSNLIQDLLSLTSIDSGKITKQMEPVNVRPILIDILTFTENEAKLKNLTMVNEISEKLPMIIGDKNVLTYLFTNLISNAIKYNKQQGSVRIKTDMTKDHLIVSVIDTGIGIAQEELDKIFTEFFRSKREEVQRVAGTGLGLNIAKRIAELHNGFIKVSSQLDQGSRFEVYLPILKMI